MKLRLPEYSGKDYLVLAITVLPITLAINSLLLARVYYSGTGIFVATTVITLVVLSILFTTCGSIAIIMKNRLPQPAQTTRRLFYMIFIFILFSGIFILTLASIYEAIPFFHYTFDKKGFIWAYFCMAIVNIFLTLVMEGIYRFKIWRENLVETEKLRKAVMQTQLQGLKSQVNPHFLFNSLNTLSSLITEDEAAAEKFLNEMTRVYRYMLGGNDETLVTLETELKFIESYRYLLHQRFGSSMQIHINVTADDKVKLIPPLSLQVIIENAFTQNSMSKQKPLHINICSAGENFLLVCNTRNDKMVSNAIDFECGLDNLVTKFRLINAAEVDIRDEDTQRSIFLPLKEQVT